MHIIINSSLMVPIYEQIMEQIKTQIRDGSLRENDSLPSVRALSKELKISALTVKKAYDHLESEGFTVTVHGKRNLCCCSKPGTSIGRTKKKKSKPIWNWPFKKADVTDSALKRSEAYLNLFWRIRPC